jgi:tetratricopeptide (TPR) repeat protein
MRKHEEALEFFEKAIENNSKVTVYYKNKENTLFNLGKKTNTLKKLYQFNKNLL